MNNKDSLNINDSKDKKSIFRVKDIIILLILFISVISISYAAMLTSLKSELPSIIQNVRWDVHFENIVEKGEYVEIITPATIQGNTTDIRYQVNLLQPGSYYEFYVDVKNSGTIDARIGNEPYITGISEAQSVYTNYTVAYKDGTTIKSGDILKAGESKTIHVKIAIKDDLTKEQLPTTSQLLDLVVDLDYIQKD